MTPDELREIDARIAVAYFGWRWVRLDGFILARFFPPDGWAGPMPRFTTNPAAATMLWDKLRKSTFVVAVDSTFEGFSVHIDNGSDGVFDVEAETWMLALCKAALAMAEAKGATV